MLAEYTLYLAALLFSIGLIIVITKKNAIMILLGIELMFNAANVNLVAFSHTHSLDGQMLALFIIIVAVCEAAVGMAIVLRVYHQYRTSVPDDINHLKEPN